MATEITPSDEESSAASATGPVGNTFDKYSTTNPIERQLVQRFLRSVDRAMPERSPARVLEVGMGEGEVAARVVDRFSDASVVGLDLPDGELAANWRRRGLSGIFGDVTAIPFPNNSFDLVLAIEVLEHVKHPDRALAEIRRVAADVVVLSVPLEPWWRAGNLARGRYWRDLGNTPGHVNHWSARAFVKFVARYLEIRTVRRPFPWTLVIAESADLPLRRG